MVEIGVYSTVGRSGAGWRRLSGVSGGRCGGSMGEVSGDGCVMGENGRKDVVKMALCKITTHGTERFWYNWLRRRSMA